MSLTESTETDNAASEPEYWHTSGTYGLEIKLPKGAIDDIHQPGAADEAVDYWYSRLSDQLAALDFDKMVAEMLGYGSWTEEELREDVELTHKRYLWLAACDLGDDLDLESHRVE